VKPVRVEVKRVSLAAMGSPCQAGFRIRIHLLRIRIQHFS
jgi:hypothetical protein